MADIPAGRARAEARRPETAKMVFLKEGMLLVWKIDEIRCY